MRMFPLLITSIAFFGCDVTSTDRVQKMTGSSLPDNHPDLFEIFDTVFGRYGTIGYDRLTEPEKVFVRVWELESEVNNGGFDQYYFNSSGDHALDAPAALLTIGAKQAAKIVEQANEVFGAAGPASNREQRQKQLDTLRDSVSAKLSALDEEFFKYPDNLEQLLGAYVSKHAAVFQSK